ncbi:MAG: ComF family protein [Bacteroidia bacterium]|nr:ComF family protein [Bacteroidia bacterium]
MLKDLLTLFYPKVCAACGGSLYKHEGHLCNNCYVHLPKSNFHVNRGNPVERLFWGRVPLLAAGSFYLFNKGTRVQKLLHELKYKGKQEAGETVGAWYGKELKSQAEFAGADVIVPVPLHPRRLKQRGYNQSLCIAKGLSAEMGIPVDETLIKRKAYSSTQTKKSKFTRWENVNEIFEPGTLKCLKGKHVLLVDDVITTGATIEACYNALAKVGVLSVSLATIAYAE